MYIYYLERSRCTWNRCSLFRTHLRRYSRSLSLNTYTSALSLDVGLMTIACLRAGCLLSFLVGDKVTACARFRREERWKRESMADRIHFHANAIDYVRHHRHRRETRRGPWRKSTSTGIGFRRPTNSSISRRDLFPLAESSKKRNTSRRANNRNSRDGMCSSQRRWGDSSNLSRATGQIADVIAVFEEWSFQDDSFRRDRVLSGSALASRLILRPVSSELSQRFARRFANYLAVQCTSSIA